MSATFATDALNRGSQPLAKVNPIAKEKEGNENAQGQLDHAGPQGQANLQQP